MTVTLPNLPRRAKRLTLPTLTMPTTGTPVEQALARMNRQAAAITVPARAAL